MIIGAPLSLDEGDFVVEHLLSSNLGKDQIEEFVAGNNAFGLEIYLKNCAESVSAPTASRQPSRMEESSR